MSNLVSLTIDGKAVEVPAGTLIIRAAEQAGIRIPRFCDHPLLKPAGACRQCLVEVAAPDREGNVRPFPKPQASCTMTVMPGMVVNTQRTSEVAAKAQRGVMEFLLINHPLDCPVCDKGGECPLQNQALANGREDSRFTDAKRLFPKPITLTSQILLDRERCILCQRCVRFADQIAGDPFIALQGRGGGSSPVDHHLHMGEQIGTFDTQVLGFTDSDTNPTGNQLSGTEKYAGPAGLPGVIGSTNFGPTHEGELDESGRPFASYFSGNVIQICPVGALTSASYRFRSRPFDLVSTPSVTEHDASGAAIRIDARRGHVTRRLAGEDPQVNEEWISDKDRFAYTWQDQPQRLRTPLVRNENGELVETSWNEALRLVAARVAADQRTAYLPGGRLTFEDAYAWAKFARVVGRTNDIDHRVRFGSEEELSFLGSEVAGTGLGVTYSELENAGHVLLVGLETEDECASVFLRLRKGVRAGGVKVTTIAPYLSNGSLKLSAKLVLAAPGTEPEVVDAIAAGAPLADLLEELNGGVLLVGERAAQTRGLLSALSRLAARANARLAWVPRRAGERGGVEAGTLPNLLPFGRTVADASARADLITAWGAELPSTTGRDALAILSAAREGALDTVFLGGVDLRDFPNPAEARAALKDTFVVSLEVNQTEATELADVVLPVAPPVEKPGTFINWEGRLRPFGQALSSTALDDRQVLTRVARAAGVELGIDTLKDLYAEVNELMEWDGQRTSAPNAPAAPLPQVQPGQAVLSTNKLLVDDALTLAGATDLRASARRPIARISRGTAEQLGISAGQTLQLSTELGSLELPVVLTTMPDKVVWVPQNNGTNVHETLGANGTLVNLTVLEVRK
ncbi:NADH-quinone oxidoreductase subunit G [Boudabousia liubingyangii]|uniref:NADH-quinone oxidoreductase subunit G n=1 Tax=Boudabousia liubingyangii TaxID=1921764 RepID=A0A1Q5PQJ0_9ACTO|nr:NADH-quinone oxidoreductase subunit G [Boudabousia liubingyangii]OKL49670.1 NADH-quinone oxidoreductase subunit G [Boudabousia liubingyangii]